MQVAAKRKEAQEKKNLKRMKAKAERQDKDKSRKRSEVEVESEQYMGSVKAAKSKMRQLREQGLSSVKAAHIAGAAGNEGKKKSKKKGSTGAGKGELFSGDGLKGQAGEGGGSGAKVSASGKPLRSSRNAMSKSDLNKVKRKGAGVHSFKSKKKYKRKK